MFRSTKDAVMFRWRKKGKKKARRSIRSTGLGEKSWQRPTLPHGVPCSTIGPGGLNDRVRDGIGCVPSGMATKKRLDRYVRVRRATLQNVLEIRASNLGLQERRKKMVKPHGRLVLVSSTRCRVSTPSLLPRGLRGAFRVLRPGRPNLEVGFPLRCFQRLSIPDVATRRYRWRDNRHTRGQSNPVLSY